MTQKIKVRFAPSPTGYLHVGNVRTALVNWLFVKKHGGTFLLRIDDTDMERSKVEYEEAIAEDLTWLGLNWDEGAKQSDRMDRYELAKQKLVASGRLYPCYETQEELDVRRKLQVSRGKPPIYDRAALEMTDEQKQVYEAEGRKPHWRFKLENKSIVWDDMVRGKCEFHGTPVSDPVLVREDGVPLYTLSSVVDDGEMAITHIIRGEDHVSNSAVQVQLFEALGYAVPQMGHIALLKMKDGELSKRKGGGDIRSMRAKGIFPMAINSLLAAIGTSDAVELAPSLNALAEKFDFKKFGRAVAQYDEEELLRLNTKLVHALSYSEAHEKLEALGLRGIPEDFWNAIRENLSSLPEAKVWWELVKQPLTPVIQDADYLMKASELLPTGEWDATTWKSFTEAVKAATGRKGKELFMPLRLALTAREDGPDLSKVFQLLGREKAEQRLLGKAA